MLQGIGVEARGGGGTERKGGAERKGEQRPCAIAPTHVSSALSLSLFFFHTRAHGNVFFCCLEGWSSSTPRCVTGQTAANAHSAGVEMRGPFLHTLCNHTNPYTVPEFAIEQGISYSVFAAIALPRKLKKTKRMHFTGTAHRLVGTPSLKMSEVRLVVACVIVTISPTARTHRFSC